MKEKEKFLTHEQSIIEDIAKELTNYAFFIESEVVFRPQTKRFDGVIYDEKSNPYAIIEVKMNLKKLNLTLIINQMLLQLQLTRLRFAIITDGKDFYFIDRIKNNQNISQEEKLTLHDVIIKLVNKTEVETPHKQNIIKILKKTLGNKSFLFFDIINNITEKDIIFESGKYSFSEEIEDKIFS